MSPGLQVSDLPFRYHTDVAVHLALDLVLKHAVGLGQLANDGEDLAAISDLAELGLKGNFLAENELMCWHIHLRLAQLRNPHLVDAPLDHHLGMLTIISRRNTGARPFHNTGMLARRVGVIFLCVASAIAKLR